MKADSARRRLRDVRLKLAGARPCRETMKRLGPLRPSGEIDEHAACSQLHGQEVGDHATRTSSSMAPARVVRAGGKTSRTPTPEALVTSASNPSRTSIRLARAAPILAKLRQRLPGADPDCGVRRPGPRAAGGGLVPACGQLFQQPGIGAGARPGRRARDRPMPGSPPPASCDSAAAAVRGSGCRPARLATATASFCSRAARRHHLEVLRLVGGCLMLDPGEQARWPSSGAGSPIRGPPDDGRERVPSAWVELAGGGLRGAPEILHEADEDGRSAGSRQLGVEVGRQAMLVAESRLVPLYLLQHRPSDASCSRSPRLRRSARKNSSRSASASQAPARAARWSSSVRNCSRIVSTAVGLPRLSIELSGCRPATQASRADRYARGSVRPWRPGPSRS